MKWLNKIIELIKKWLKKEPEEPNTPRVEPSDPPMEGNFGKKPEIVYYKFILKDKTTLEFRDFMIGDYWGGFPAAGWGQITHPDGRREGIDVNTKIRHHSGNGIAVTKLTHGKRYFWNTSNGKKVDVYSDGWMPHVERKTDAALLSMGFSPIVECKSRVEKFQ